MINEAQKQPRFATFLDNSCFGTRPISMKRYLTPLLAAALIIGGSISPASAESVTRENIVQAFVELETASHLIGVMHEEIIASLPPDEESITLTEFPKDKLPLYQKAFGHLQKSAELNPYIPEVHSKIGDYYNEALRDKAKALAAYDKAIELLPAYIPALGARASILLDLGKLDDAKSAIEALQEIDPEQSEFLAERYKQLVEQPGN